MSEQREVRVHLNSFVFDGETLYCQLKDGRYEAHITIDVEETGLRSARRFPVRLPARMFPPHGSPVDIAIVDISGDGLGIELPVPVEVGQPIANGSAFVFAVVAHCRPVAEGVFRAGVEMQHVFERCAEVPVAESRSGLLGRVFGKRQGGEMARPEGLEPPAYWFEANRSIQLSYGRAWMARDFIVSEGRIQKEEFRSQNSEVRMREGENSGTGIQETE
jgi:hypothetical protein